MCGRFSLGVDTDRLVHELGIDSVAEQTRPRWNIAPGQPIPAVVRGPGGLRLGSLRWGLVPHWTNDPPGAGPFINARSESVDRKPAFEESFRLRRCLIPADGFYEWRREGDGGRSPFHLRLPDGHAFTMAGLWDRWRDRDGSPLHSCAILTTTASPDVAPIHHRMPVILHPEARRVWLEPDADQRTLLSLLRPYDGRLEAVPVSRRVNRTDQDGIACIAPVAIRNLRGRTV